MIQDVFVWNPNAALLSLDIVRNCRECEIYQTFHDLPPELPRLKPTPIFSRWHLDFAGPLPSSNGYQHFLIAADYTSNLILVAPTTSQNTKVVLEMLLRICGTFGTPELIITDNGTPFNNTTVHDFAHKAKFQLAHSSAYYPRGNAKAERSVQLLKTALKRLTPNYADWSNYLTRSTQIVNTTPLLYGYSPRQIAFGDKTRPADVDIQISLDHIDIMDPIEDMTHKENVHLALFYHRHINEARTATYKAQDKIRDALLHTRQDTENEVPYMKGELVYRFRVKKKKHEPSWDGPYRIFEQTAKNTYKLISLDNRIGKIT